MPAPTATATLNKSAYADGEVMTLTIDHNDVDREVLTVSGVVTGTDGATSNVWSATATIDEGAVVIQNTGGKSWTIQSATLNRTVLTAVA